jgi:bis(5'-nucleosyl)-tetraphosphatase (symmetrical)
MRGNVPVRWEDSLSGHDRTRTIVNALTRLRFCTSGGEMEFTTKTEIAPPGYLAWYEVPQRATATVNLLYGHWAARGLTLQDTVLGIDTGCVLGRQLTALRLEDRKLVQVDCLVGKSGYGPA